MVQSHLTVYFALFLPHVFLYSYLCCYEYFTILIYGLTWSYENDERDVVKSMILLIILEKVDIMKQNAIEFKDTHEFDILLRRLRMNWFLILCLGTKTTHIRVLWVWVPFIPSPIDISCSRNFKTKLWSINEQIEIWKFWSPKVFWS